MGALSGFLSSIFVRSTDNFSVDRTIKINPDYTAAQYTQVDKTSKFDPVTRCLISEVWRGRNGKPFRKDGPSIIKYDPDTGSVTYQAWTDKEGNITKSGFGVGNSRMVYFDSEPS